MKTFYWVDGVDCFVRCDQAKNRRQETEIQSSDVHGYVIHPGVTSAAYTLLLYINLSVFCPSLTELEILKNSSAFLWTTKKL